MTFDESELVIQEEITKVEAGSRAASHAAGSVADVQVGFSASSASASTSRAATRMTGRPETALSGAPNSSIVQQVKKTMKGALTGATISMITELGKRVVFAKYLHISLRFGSWKPALTGVTWCTNAETNRKITIVLFVLSAQIKSFMA